MKLLAQIRALPPARAWLVVAMHVLLLASVLLGGLPYVCMQLLLAFELVAITLSTIPLYPERGARKHAFDLIKVVALLSFVLFFLVVTYGVASRHGDSQAPIRALFGFDRIGAGAFAWAVLYVAVHVGVTLKQALAAPVPRRAWAGTAIKEGGITLVAMLLMIFAALPGGIATASLQAIGVPIDADSVLATLMVALRGGLALVAETMTPGELDEIAGNPYID